MYRGDSLLWVNKKSTLSLDNLEQIVIVIVIVGGSLAQWGTRPWPQIGLACGLLARAAALSAHGLVVLKTTTRGTCKQPHVVPHCFNL